MALKVHSVFFIVTPCSLVRGE